MSVESSYRRMTNLKRTLSVVTLVLSLGLGSSAQAPWTAHVECIVEGGKASDLRSSEAGELTKHHLSYESIPNDGILRHYRLAVLIDYSIYRSEFGGDMARVRQYWDELQAFLNSTFLRDLGIRLELLRDERLVRQTQDAEIFSNLTGRQIMARSTGEITKLIGEDAFDLGISMAVFTSTENGVSHLEAAYTDIYKARSAVRISAPATVAHELGHLFGANHTGAAEQKTTWGVELGRGQSIMSYGADRTFFSLFSIREIRSKLYARPYITSYESRPAKVSAYANPNYALGIRQSHMAPRLDRTKLRASYTIPRYTLFGFRPEVESGSSESLMYSAQPMNHAQGQGTHGQVFVRPPSAQARIDHRPEYSHAGGSVAGTVPVMAGTFNYWLTASRGSVADALVPMYDTYATELRVVEGKPFVQTSNMKPVYGRGEHVQLRWDVDQSIFGTDSQVRILLSDDYGQTYRYVLEQATPNDGEHEVILPYELIGTNRQLFMRPISPCVIRIEVIDHVAFALSSYKREQLNNDNWIYLSGFAIEANSSLITFDDTPEREVRLKAGDPIPPKAEVLSRTTFGRTFGRIAQDTYREEERDTPTERIIRRIWTAKTSEGYTASFVQTLRIAKADTTPTPPPTPTPSTFTVTIAPSLHGTIETRPSNLSNLPAGTVIEVIPRPDADYHLVTLLAGGEDITRSLRFTLGADTELRATFAQTSGLTYPTPETVSIYPTETSGLVHIRTDRGPTTVAVYSLRGQRVAQWDAVTQIDLTHLPSGHYVVVLYQDGQISGSQRIYRR